MRSASSAIDTFRELAATFAATRAPRDQERLTSALCAAASTSQRPLMSIQALARHHLPGLPTALRAAIVHQAQAQYTELRDIAPQAVSEDAPPKRRWVPLAEAAVILGLSTNYIRPRLVWPQWRRLWGWPRWTGTEWRFPLDAIDGARGAALIASLSTQEPEGPLPPGHHRHDDPAVDWQEWPGGRSHVSRVVEVASPVRTENRGGGTVPAESTSSTTSGEESTT